jgi:homoserine dehydrogenase
LKIALIGYGHVARALVRLIRAQRREFPFLVTGIHTLRHGTAVNRRGLKATPKFGPRAESVEAFLAGVYKI